MVTIVKQGAANERTRHGLLLRIVMIHGYPDIGGANASGKTTLQRLAPAQALRNLRMPRGDVIQHDFTPTPALHGNRKAIGQGVLVVTLVIKPWPTEIGGVPSPH